MHWYLIIIYQPGNLLLPSSFKAAPLSSHKRIRSSDEVDGSEQERAAESAKRLIHLNFMILIDAA